MTSRSDPEPARQPPSAQHPPVQYEPYLDGLFTYCMSVLCDRDDAVAALGDVLAIAERRPRQRPATPAEWRPWLYSLARWACLRRMARKPAHRSAQRPAPKPAPPPAGENRSATGHELDAEPEAAAHERRRELAALAWPEAAGTTPEQREALELAVRHRLPADEVATVLGRDPDSARVLLSTAAAEVERTRAALAVVDQHGCPAIARLAGDSRLFLSAALSRELVRHVDDCADCRRAAERAGAGWAWPGTLRAARPEGPLPVLPAPRAAAHAAMLRAQRTRFAHPPRFDRRGYPRDPRHRAARRGRLRSRAVTSTAVATVLAAPVLALWAANRGAPVTGEAQSGWPPPRTGADADEPESLDGRPVEKAGSAHDEPSPGPSDPRGGRPDVSVEVVDHGGRSPGRPGVGPGRLTVEAWPGGEVTYLRLRASGGTAVDWRVGTDAPWLRFSATYGMLRPGEATTVAVSVAAGAEPRGGWEARVYVSPGGAAILISGEGSGGTGTRPGTGTGSPDPSPSAPGPSPSDPGPSPSDPGPSPSDPGPSPSDPDPSPSDPGPSPSDPGPSPSDPSPSPTASDPDPSPPASSPPPAPLPSPVG